MSRTGGLKVRSMFLIMLRNERSYQGLKPCVRECSFMTYRRQKIAHGLILGFSAIATVSALAIGYTVARITPERRAYIKMHDTQANYDRWDRMLDAAGYDVSQHLTSDAFMLVTTSSLTHEWLEPHKALKNDVPGALYRNHSNERVVDRQAMNSEELDALVMHESVHRLYHAATEEQVDSAERVLDLDAFSSIYEKLDPEEWKCKEVVEQYLNVKHDSEELKKEDNRTNERLAYVVAWWYTGKFTIPDEMKDIFRTAFNVDKIEAKRNGVLTAGLRH